MEHHLVTKTIVGFLLLAITMGLLLFIPAGTIRYLQAWFYLFTFNGSTIWITLYLFKNDRELLKRRVKAGSIAEKEKSQKVIQTVANILFCPIYIVAGLDFRFHWSKLPEFISYSANVFVFLGFYIVFLVFKENSYTSAIIEVNKDQKVISTGMYAVVRHPMYLGALLMLVFTSVALGSYWSLLCVATLIIAIIVRLLNEEKFLSENLDGYKEYCKKVSYHLIPYIW